MSGPLTLAGTRKTTLSMPVALTWRRLVVAAAVGDLLMLAWRSLTTEDRFALGLMVPILIGLCLVHFGSGSVGRVVLGLSMADMTWYTISGAISNAINHQGPAAVVAPGWLGACSIAGVAAVVASLLHRSGTFGPRLTADLAAAGLLTLIAASVVLDGTTQLPPDPVGITTQAMAFSTRSLSAEAGQVTVQLTNRDLSWHTFTIDSLGVDLKVPVNAEGVATFEAAPGTYSFYCSIPGHAALGMRGTLVVH